MALIQVKNNPRIKALVVYPYVYERHAGIDKDNRLEEAIGLSLAIDLDVIYSEIVNIRDIKAGTFFSKGFLDRVVEIIAEKQPELMVVDTSLSPIQQRSLEKLLKIKVIDRTALILEIFGARAQTKEGVLQVELAKLNYQRSRLVKMWSHLGRQRGSTSFIGGEGEKQIELDRRMIDDKILNLQRELQKVQKTRDLHRVSRRKIPYPIVALVGYTNVGKSSIFNKLTKADVFVEDLLFATLDPTMRKIVLPSGIEVILSDTVGFISDLPHELVLSFRSTLEEVLEADIVLHVRDVSSKEFVSQKQDVLEVLKSLGLDNVEHDGKYIEVFNKVDAVLEEDSLYYKNKAKEEQNMVATSAHTGEGLNNLLTLIDKKLSANFEETEIELSASDGKMISWLHNHSEVLDTNLLEDKIFLKIKIDTVALSRFYHIIG